jgi:hypothetical protein
VPEGTAEEAEKGKRHEEHLGYIVREGVEGGEGQEADSPEQRREKMGMNIYLSRMEMRNEK